MDKKIKVVLFDVDGVLIRPPHYFSTELQKQGYKNAEEILGSFFTGGDYHQCSEGKINSFDLIVPYLEKIGWEEGAENYFLKQFEFEGRYLDEYLISSIVEGLKNKGIKVYLSTDQEKNRADFLLNDMKFKDIFEKQFISHVIGYRKCHDEFWVKVLGYLKKEFGEIDPSEIVFFDDIKNNIEVASKFGIKSFLFTDLNQFGKDMQSINLL